MDGHTGRGVRVDGGAAYQFPLAAVRSLVASQLHGGGEFEMTTFKRIALAIAPVAVLAIAFAGNRLP